MKPWRSCEDGSPQKVNIPIILHHGNPTSQLTPPPDDSSVSTTLWVTSLAKSRETSFCRKKKAERGRARPMIFKGHGLDRLSGRGDSHGSLTVGSRGGGGMWTHSGELVFMFILTSRSQPWISSFSSFCSDLIENARSTSITVTSASTAVWRNVSV